MGDTFDSSRPIYTQIVERLQGNIIAGRYPPGARLDSVRDLAAAAGVNPNTMQRALQELERQGLVRTERTAGRFVTEDTELVEKLRLATAEKMVAEFVAQMQSYGFTPARLAELLEQYPETTEERE